MTCAVLGLCVCAVSAQSRPGAAPASPLSAFAFVSNELARSVSAIDLARGIVTRTFALTGRPRGIQARDNRVFVATSDVLRDRRSDADAIVALDPVDGRIVARYDGGSDPETFVLSRDGARLFASNEDAGTTTVTELRSGRPLATLVVGIEPEGAAISPDGRWVYITAETSNSVSVIDTATLRVVSSFLVDARPRAAAFSPDGTRAYVTAEIGGSLTVVDARRHRVIRSVKLPAPAHPVGVVVLT